MSFRCFLLLNFICFSCILPLNSPVRVKARNVATQREACSASGKHVNFLVMGCRGNLSVSNNSQKIDCIMSPYPSI